MKELAIQQQIKEAYTAIHAPESLIRTVLSQIDQAHRDDRIAQTSMTLFPEQEKNKPTK